MSKRRCRIEGCQERQLTLHYLPRDISIRDQWLMFIFSEIPDDVGKNVTVCSAHFTADCFVNQAQFNAGFSKRLVIKDTAVPTLLGPTSTPQLGIVGSICKIFPSVKHVGCQTEDKDRRTVGTQLSMKTLANTFRSTGTQVKAASKNCGVCTLTFPLDSPLLLLQPTITQRPSKRPRLSLTDEEEGPSECRLSKEDQEPEDST